MKLDICTPRSRRSDQPGQHLDLDLEPPELWDATCCSISRPVCGALFWQSEQADTETATNGLLLRILQQNHCCLHFSAILAAQETELMVSSWSRFPSELLLLLLWFIFSTHSYRIPFVLLCLFLKSRCSKLVNCLPFLLSADKFTTWKSWIMFLLTSAISETDLISTFTRLPKIYKNPEITET